MSEVQGLALTAIGVQFSILANSAIKTVTGVPVTQAMQLRFILQFLCTGSLALVFKYRGHDVHFLGKPDHRVMLLGRAISFAGAIVCLWTALRLLPVGIATTTLYLYPVFTGILANFTLRESLGWRFWVQAAISFIGVILTAAPGFASGGSSDATRGIVLVLTAACCFATANCLVRALKGAQTIEVQFFTDTVMAFVVMPTTLLLNGEFFDWTSWQGIDLLKLTGATAAGLTALLIVIRGHQLAEASKATLFTYLEIPGSYVMQILGFHDFPSGQQFFGAGLIVTAAMVRFWYEATTARKVDPLLKT